MFGKIIKPDKSLPEGYRPKADKAEVVKEEKVWTPQEAYFACLKRKFPRKRRPKEADGKWLKSTSNKYEAGNHEMSRAVPPLPPLKVGRIVKFKKGRDIVK